ncbi:hypothetical protein [Blastococcus sp. CT_GayMR16]|nr:hypothetical protein [Blastococcus sp. CT_GayMR16]
MTIRGYEVLQWTQHWRVVHGTYYRDAVARRLTDGAVRLISVPDQ